MPASAASSSSRSWARSRIRFGSTSSTSAVSGRRSGSRCSRSASHGSHDSMPSNTWPSAMRSHCSRPQGCVLTSAAALAHLRGGQQLARRKDPRARRRRGWSVGRRPRTRRADRLRHPRGRCAPGGRRWTGRRRRSSRAPRARRATPPGTHVGTPRRRGAPRARRGRRGRPCARRPARAPRRAAPGAAPAPAPAPRAPTGTTRTEPPQHTEATAHRRQRRRDPLEGQGLPRREQLDVVGPQELREVVHEPFGLRAGRHREHERPARGDVGQRGHEQRARGVGHRHDRITIDDRAHRRLLREEAGERGERWGLRHQSHCVN